MSTTRSLQGTPEEYEQMMIALHAHGGEYDHLQYEPEP
jgi:hypothetical protein